MDRHRQNKIKKNARKVLKEYRTLNQIAVNAYNRGGSLDLSYRCWSALAWKNEILIAVEKIDSIRIKTVLHLRFFSIPKISSKEICKFLKISPSLYYRELGRGLCQFAAFYRYGVLLDDNGLEVLDMQVKQEYYERQKIAQDLISDEMYR